MAETYSLKQDKKPGLMKYFDRAHAHPRNPARRHQQNKISATAHRRRARQATHTRYALLETSEQVVPQPQLQPQQSPSPSQPQDKASHTTTHPHLLAIFKEQQSALNELDGPLAVLQTTLAPPAPTDSIHSELLDLKQEQTASTASAAAPASATAGAATAAAAPAATTTGTTTATTAATTAAAGGAVAATGATAAPTGGSVEPASTAGSAPDLPVVDSVVPLTHLQQLQQELSAVEAEHAKYQAQLNAELKAQQAQTAQLLQQEHDGTVGLTMIPQLVDPEVPPLDPTNEQLYDNAPVSDGMAIKPSVLDAAQGVAAAANAQHIVFAHNMPIECTEPTCEVS